MKKYSVIAFALFLATILSSNELSWVDTQVEAIKPPRKGMSNSNIANIKSPFIFLRKNKKKGAESKSKSANYVASSKITTSSSNSSKIVSPKAGPLILSAVINNSALINGKWYKINDKVLNYKLSSVNRTSVILTKGERKIVLSTSDTKRNLKFK